MSIAINRPDSRPDNPVPRKVKAPMRRKDRALGRRVRLRRQRLGISVCDLAYRVDLTDNALRNIELAHVEPTCRTLRALVRELQVTADHLLFGGPL